jgi:hypothetical protein
MWRTCVLGAAALTAVMAPLTAASEAAGPGPPRPLVAPLPLRATPPTALVRRYNANGRKSLAGWVRHEGKWFIWYAPDRSWQDVQSVGGIDLASGDGTQAVAFGFSGWPTPLTFQDVVAYWLRAIAAAGVITDIRFTSVGSITQQGAIYRSVSTWSGYRSDLQQKVSGVLTIHVYRDDAQGIYGFDNFTRAGPAAGYAALDPTLLRIQNLVIYKPHDPPCIRHDPACEPGKKKKK